MTDTDAPKLRIDISQLKMREWAKVEELAGLPYTWLGNEMRPQSMLQTALITVWMQRTDPAYTFEQAAENTLGVLIEGMAPPGAAS